MFFVLAPTERDAIDIGNYVVKNKLAACANIVRNIRSIYRWKGNIEEDNEVLILIKTREDKCDALIAAIEKIHSYETPECIGLKINKGSEDYLKWLTHALNSK